MKCQRCNKEIKEGELFCNYCGAKVAKDNIEDTKITLNIKRLCVVKDCVKDM